MGTLCLVWHFMPSHNSVSAQSVHHNQLRHACISNTASRCVLECSELDCLNIAPVSWGLVKYVFCHAFWVDVMPKRSQTLDCDITAFAGGTCVLAISPESEARWYFDAGSTAMGSGHNDPPNVHCPITIGVGANAEGPVDYLNTEGIKQAPRFSKGRSDWLTFACTTVADFRHHMIPFSIHATALCKVLCMCTQAICLTMPGCYISVVYICIYRYVIFFNQMLPQMLQCQPVALHCIPLLLCVTPGSRPDAKFCVYAL